MIKEELIREKMPTLCMEEGKHFISYLSIVFNHSTSMTYDLEMNFKIEPSSENVCKEDSVSGDFNLKMHANFQGLIDFIEPLIRGEIGVADTTSVKINYVRIYPRHKGDGVWTMFMSYKAECSAIGCSRQEHQKEIEYIPEIFAKVNEILKDSGFRLNLNMKGMPVSEPMPASVVDDRFEILDL